MFHDFRYHPKEVITGSFDDWAYDHLGLFAWVIEFWSPQRAAGIADYKFIEWYREHPVEDDLKLLAGTIRRSPAAASSTGIRSATRSSERSSSAAGTLVRFWFNLPLSQLEQEVKPRRVQPLPRACPHLEIACSRQQHNWNERSR